MTNKLSKYLKANPDPDTESQIMDFIIEIKDEIKEKVWNEATEICDGFLTKAYGVDSDNGKIIDQASRLAEEFIYKALKKLL